MSYITDEMTRQALVRMQEFFMKLKRLFDGERIFLFDDQCRRNNLMSGPQERFFADEIGKIYRDVVNNGKTGEPDIVVGQLNRELECKLTSPRANGCIQLQTDYTTLCKKGSLDYLYVIADKRFESFCVLHFQNLTQSDYHDPCSGSRGKARMNKSLAMKKCQTLWGNSVDINTETVLRMENKLGNLTSRALVTRAKTQDKIEAWKNKPTQYRFELERVIPDEKRYTRRYDVV